MCSQNRLEWCQLNLQGFSVDDGLSAMIYRLALVEGVDETFEQFPFLCKENISVDTLCGQWICWILDSFCFSSRMSLRFLDCEKKACNFSNAPNKDFAAKEDPQASIITRFSTWSNVQMNIHCGLTCWTRVFTPLYFPVMTDAPS